MRFIVRKSILINSLRSAVIFNVSSFFFLFLFLFEVLIFGAISLGKLLNLIPNSFYRRGWWISTLGSLKDVCRNPRRLPDRSMSRIFSFLVIKWSCKFHNVNCNNGFFAGIIGGGLLRNWELMPHLRNLSLQGGCFLLMPKIIMPGLIGRFVVLQSPHLILDMCHRALIGMIFFSVCHSCTHHL